MFYHLKKCAALVLAAVLTTAAVNAQEKDVIREGAGYTTVLYDRSNGLPTSEANTVLQTSDGFVWIGSHVHCFS